MDYLLAESSILKENYIYVLGIDHPAKFLNSGRSIASVLGRNVKLRGEFAGRFGNQYPTVKDYYRTSKDAVIVQDILPFVPEAHCGCA
jgi:hypothetical protein